MVVIVAKGPEAGIASHGFWLVSLHWSVDNA